MGASTDVSAVAALVTPGAVTLGDPSALHALNCAYGTLYSCWKSEMGNWDVANGKPPVTAAGVDPGACAAKCGITARKSARRRSSRPVYVAPGAHAAVRLRNSCASHCCDCASLRDWGSRPAAMRRSLSCAAVSAASCAAGGMNSSTFSSPMVARRPAPSPPPLPPPPAMNGFPDDPGAESALAAFANVCTSEDTNRGFSRLSVTLVRNSRSTVERDSTAVDAEVPMPRLQKASAQNV